MATDAEKKPSRKLLGIMSIPAWIYPLWFGFWKIIEIAEHVTFIKEYFPWLIQWTMNHVPTGIDWPVAALTGAWILGLLFIVPNVAEKWGSNWAFASITVPVMIVAIILGIHRANIDIQRENDAYHKRMAAEAHKNH